jgi:SP family general alpha glucoside:H+ symporter-like MFS transporter
VYGQTACIITFNCIYFLAVGLMSWVIFAEIPSPRLRARTVTLAIVVQSLFGILLNIVIPLRISPDAGNLKGKIEFIFTGTCVLSVVWVWARVPGIKGRSFGKLDVLFERGVSAWRFEECRLDD